LIKSRINLLYLIIMLIAIIYSPALNNDFVNLDDPYYINNPYIQYLNLNKLQEIFNPSGNVDKGNYYQPLVLLSYSLDFFLWKLNPAGYHLTSVILFIITLFIVYLITVKLFKNKYIPLMTLLLFAIHPLHVEVVAWFSGRTLLLSGLFCFTALYFFILSLEKRLYIFLSLFFFLCAVMSHPVSSLFSVIILLYFYAFSSPLKEKKILYKSFFVLPFFLIVIGFQAILFFLNAQSNRIVMIKHSDLKENIFIAVNVLGKYCELLFWPQGLSAIYPVKLENSFLLSILLCFLLIFFLFYFFIRDKKLFFSTAWFVIFYIPVSNLFFIVNPDMLIADRYLYLPSFGFFLAFSILTYKLLEFSRKVKYGKILKAVLCIILIIMTGSLSYLTYERCRVWKNSLTLWNDALKKYPHAYKAYNGRGLYYMNSEEYERAMADFNSALMVNPLYDEGYYNRGKVYSIKGNYDKALDDYTVAINIYEAPEYYNERAKIYYERGEYDRAIIDYSQVLNINPLSAAGYNNRGNVYNKKGEYDKAIDDFNKALRLEPAFHKTYMNRALSYYLKKEYNKSWEDVRKLNELGYKVDPGFLELLKKASGREKK